MIEIGVGKRGVPINYPNPASYNVSDTYQLTAKLVAQNVKSVIPIPASRMSYLIGYNNKLSACGHLMWGPLS